MKITGSMFVPDIFVGGGQWTYVQLIEPKRFRYQINGGAEISHSGKVNGKFNRELSLDSAFPYPFNDNSTNGSWSPNLVGPSTPSSPTMYGIATDSPRTALVDLYHRYSVNSESFEMHQLFLPPGDGQWVPISKFTWNWSANVQRTGSIWNDIDYTPKPPGTTSATGTGTRNTTHPKWYRKISNSQLGYN